MHKLQKQSSKEKVRLTRREACGYVQGKGGFCPKENKERRKHYKKIREAGFSPKVACSLRDWRLTKIERFIEARGKGT